MVCDGARATAHVEQAHPGLEMWQEERGVVFGGAPGMVAPTRLACRQFTPVALPLRPKGQKLRRRRCSPIQRSPEALATAWASRPSA